MQMFWTSPPVSVVGADLEVFHTLIFTFKDDITIKYIFIKTVVSSKKRTKTYFFCCFIQFIDNACITVFLNLLNKISVVCTVIVKNTNLNL